MALSRDERDRYRVRAAYRIGEIGESDRDALLDVSTTLRRNTTEWGRKRRHSTMQRLAVLAWGGNKYDGTDHHGVSIANTLDDREATGKIVDWIESNYKSEETKRDMRVTLRVFGKILTNPDPTDKDARPPQSIDWVSADTPRNYKPQPEPSDMWSWEEVREACKHPGTNARDAAILAVAWDAHPRSGELHDNPQDEPFDGPYRGDVTDEDFGVSIHFDGKTGPRDVTITMAVPYLRQWLNVHPGGERDDAPLWSHLKTADPISYRMFRDIFKDAAERVGQTKPNDPTNFRKSGISALASGGMNQAKLEDRAGWETGSSAASRYITIFGKEGDIELAKARGMDIDLDEPDPTGPKQCFRCGELIDREAEECDNCGAIQDREKAQQAVAERDPDIIRGAVREEIQSLLEDPGPEAIEDASGIASMVDGMWQDSIDAKIENAVEEALENRTGG